MMRKIISCILCLAISISLLAVPVHAESNIYSAYLGVLNDAVEKYGEYTAGEYQKSTGVGYVNLVDFDGDGVNELIYCVGETHDYTYHIYGYKDGSAVLLDEGSMEAHGGDSNWEISILYNSAKSRLITYRHDGSYMNSTYISVGEYSDGEWNTLKDIFVEDYCEVEPGGAYYMVYYINNEQVDESEFNNRFNSLSRHGGRIDIRWTDFSGEYLEEVGQSLSDMNYWFGDKTVTLNDATTNDYYQENYKKYISALYEAFNNQYIDPYSGKSYFDNDNFVYIAILSLWEELALSRDSETVKYFEDMFSSEDLPNGHVLVYNTKELAQVLRFKFENIDLYELLNSGFYGLIYSDDDYVVLASSGYGDRIEEMVIDKFEMINDNTVYVEWHADYQGNKSSEMYAILEKAQICGLEIVGYRYLSTIKPTSDTVDSYSKPINIIINGSEIHFDNMPRIVGGRTMVPLRKIFEALGVSVEWNGNTNTITASDGVKNFEMQIENLEYKVNGQVRTLDVPAMLINDSTYVPARVIAEAFDADVSWNQNTRTVSINSELPSATASPCPCW